MIDFTIDIFMQWFSEGFAEKLFAPLYRLIDKKWPNNKVVKIILICFLLAIICVISILLSLGIVIAFVFIIIKIFHILSQSTKILYVKKVWDFPNLFDCTAPYAGGS